MPTDALPPIADLLARLQHDQLLDDSEWQRLYVGAGQEVIEHLLQRAAGGPPTRRAAAIERLCFLARQAPWRKLLTDPCWTVPLSQLLASLSPDDDGTALSLGQDGCLPLMASLLRCLGPAALPIARSLLADPPPAGCLSYGCEAPALATASPLLVALEVLRRLGDSNDTAVLLALVGNPTADLLTRCEAAALLHRLAQTPPDPAPLLQAVLTASWSSDYAYGQCIERLLAGGASLVSPAVGLLGHGEWAVRQRAASVLVALGAPAALALAEVVATAEGWPAQTLAEETLARLDRSLLRAARRRRRSLDRALSLSRAEPTAERGLSRSEAP